MYSVSCGVIWINEWNNCRPSGGGVREAHKMDRDRVSGGVEYHRLYWNKWNNVDRIVEYLV